MSSSGFGASLFVRWMHVANKKDILCAGHNSYYKCKCGSCSQIIRVGGVYFSNTNRGPFCENCARYFCMFPDELYLPKTAIELKQMRMFPDRVPLPNKSESDLKQMRRNKEAEAQALRKKQALRTLADIYEVEHKTKSQFRKENV